MDVRRRTNLIRWHQRRRMRANGASGGFGGAGSGGGVPGRNRRSFLLALAVLAALALRPSPSDPHSPVSPQRCRRGAFVAAEAAPRPPVGVGGGRRKMPRSTAARQASKGGPQKQKRTSGGSPAPALASASSAPSTASQASAGVGDGPTPSKSTRRDGPAVGAPPPTMASGSASARARSNGALVVCGVDGTVYTLDAWTGGLRGLFASGPELVGSSSSGGGRDGDDDPGSDGGDGQWGGDEDDDCGECFDLDGEDGFRFLDPAPEDDEGPGREKSVEPRQKIVPGLDGHLYALSPDGGDRSSSSGGGQRKLDRLPISVMDVVDSPVTTCSAPSSFDEAKGFVADSDEDGQCGLVMGQRRVTIFSLDPGSGTVGWMQKPGGAHEGFTTAMGFGAGGREGRKRKKDARGGKGSAAASVLLQREDYYVRSVDVESGLEHWNVTVGRFSALDFGSGDAAAQNAGGGRDQHGGGTHPGGHAARSAAAAKAGQHKKSPLSLGWTGHHQDEDDKEEEHLAGSSFMPLPSVAFGEDGNIIMAVDSSTGRLLWRRRIESVVAAVYGVGGGRFGGWVPLEVVDNYNPLLQGAGQAIGSPADPMSFDLFSQDALALSSNEEKLLLPSPTIGDNGVGTKGARLRPGGSTLSSTSLVPYAQGAISSSALVHQQGGSDAGKTHPSSIARLGEQSSTLFVASTTPVFGAEGFGAHNGQLGENSCSPDFMDICDSSKADLTDILAPWDAAQGDEGTSGLRLDFDQIVEESPEWQKPPLQHHTTRMEHGLFLSWRMVSLLILLMFTAALSLRLAYLRQRAKWQAEATPLLVPTNPNSLETGGEQANRRDGIERSPTGLSLPSPEHMSLNGVTLSGIEALGYSVPARQRLLSTSSHAVQPQRQTPLSSRSMSLPHLASLNAETRRGPIKKKRSSLCLKDEDVAKMDVASTGALNESLFDIDASESGSNEEDSAPLGSLPMLRATTNVTSSTPPMSNSPPRPSSSLFRNASAPTQFSTLMGQAQQDHGVGSIDGIPLIRYSRYRSEFSETSALGKGGFGTVFRCENALDGREYAVKKIRIMSKVDVAGRVTKHFSQKLQRVLREVKILALLDHPTIVRYYTAWLELDDEVGDDNQSISSSFTSRGGNTTRFSSEIPSNTFAGPSATLGSVSPLKSRSMTPSKNRIRKSQYSATRANPLGWNQFFTSFQPDGRSSSLFDEASKEKDNSSEATDSKEIVRCVSSATDEDDLGFTWERSSSGKLRSPTIRRNKLSKDALSLVADASSASSGSDSDYEDSSSCSSESSESSDSSSESERSASETNVSTGSPSNGCGGSGSGWVKGHFLSTPPVSKHPTISSLKRKGSGASLSIPLPSMSSSEKVPESHQMTSQKHILFIQMQLCSQKTLGDFLENAEARRGPSDGESVAENEVDIPNALRLFRQIARGVKHVHSHGLIHRDLKPSNCFIDDAGNVKIGDFGLSRESAVTGGIGKAQDDEEDDDESLGDVRSKDSRRNSLGGDDNTIGVGTRSYASPEQMSESDYDSSTDVYSLGIMLFELCYPMSTGMERVMVFKGIRKRDFPDLWHSTVAVSFPSIHALAMKMLSPVPSERPTAAAVADHVDSLLSEYTVLSLDRTHRREGSVLLRVEAAESDGVLSRTIQLIKDSDQSVDVMQYSLRGQESKAIMEFALSVTEPDDEKDETRERENSVRNVISALNENREIGLVRQVTEKHAALSRGHSIEVSTQQQS